MKLQPTIRATTTGNLAHDAYYTNSVPEAIGLALNSVRRDIEKNVLVNFELQASKLYDFTGLLKALGVMTQHPLTHGTFYLGLGDDIAVYGLINVAAFLAQRMVESIKYDACDEASHEYVNNKFPSR